MNRNRLFLLALLLLVGNSIAAQTVLIKGLPDDRPLVWDDFTGTPEETSPYDAFIYWNIRYRFQPQFVGDSVKAKATVFLEMSDRSWARRAKRTDALLRHEQGHFDIARLCAQAFIKTLELRTFSKQNLGSEINQTFRDLLETYKQMERDYDLDTNHSKNIKQQQKWEALLATRLKENAAAAPR